MGPLSKHSLRYIRYELTHSSLGHMHTVPTIVHIVVIRADINSSDAIIHEIAYKHIGNKNRAQPPCICT